MLATLAVLLAVGDPCPVEPSVPPIQAVRQSAAFAGALTPAWHAAIVAMGGSPEPAGSSLHQWWLQAMCRGMRADSSPLLSHGAIVMAPYLHGIEVSVLRFGVLGDTVVLLNQLDREGEIAASLSVAAWNEWLRRAPLAQPLSSRPLAEAYVCLLHSLVAGRALAGCQGWSPPVNETDYWHSDRFVFARDGTIQSL